ncbi:hypothetical protein QGN29_10915 [Temperatibacter marinus]|uniref:Uncharacterized protein n=1 Tax=Temperatibacter marinus TaxID=1456591 RepID=A0AA52EFB5_9PROT|nr:hypothetical protein [Temperatibacter marinus]WND02058.1 hypothetical protein QGN29_10915 [Temperatibacter marinus]
MKSLLVILKKAVKNSRNILIRLKKKYKDFPLAEGLTLLDTVVTIISAFEKNAAEQALEDFTVRRKAGHKFEAFKYAPRQVVRNYAQSEEIEGYPHQQAFNDVIHKMDGANRWTEEGRDTLTYLDKNKSLSHSEIQEDEGYQSLINKLDQSLLASTNNGGPRPQIDLSVFSRQLTCLEEIRADIASIRACLGEIFQPRQHTPSLPFTFSQTSLSSELTKEDQTLPTLAKPSQQFLPQSSVGQTIELKQPTKDTLSSILAETKKGHKLLKAEEKGKALYTAGIAMQENIAQAMKAGFPLNLVLMAQAAAQGKKVIQTIKGQFHNGVSFVPGSGSYYLQGGERVLAKETNLDLKAFMKGMKPQSASPAAIDRSFKPDVTVNVTGDVSEETIHKARQSFKNQLTELYREHCLISPFPD